MSGASISFAVLIYVGYRVGTWLDAKWKSAPLMLFLGIVLGATLGMWQLIRIADRFKK